MSTILPGLDLDEELLCHLSDPASWVVINGEGLSPELIEDDFVRDIFVWQKQHIRKHGRPATGSVLSDQFQLDGDLAEFLPQTTIGDLLDRLRERYAKNRQREVMKELVKLQHDDPLAVHQALVRKGRELSNLLAKRGEMFGTGDYDRAMYHYDQKVKQGPGASFGHQMLDDYFYGMRGLTFLLAPPKRFKSWQMIKGQVMNAQRGQCAWLYCLELPAEETDMRLRCLLADIPWWHYVHSCITREERERLREVSDEIDSQGIYKIVKPPHGQRGIDEMVYKARDAGADVIFLDQLQFIENQNGISLGSMNQTGEYWGVIDRARELSDEGPICVAHQFNRNTMYAAEMPPIEMAKGSSAIEEFATTAIGIWGDKEMVRSGHVQVGTLIARNHLYAAWDMEIQLKHGCSFEIVGRADLDGDTD